MRTEQRLREELAGVLRDAGLQQVDDPNILDFDFAERLGLGSIELADLLIRVGNAYAVELPSDGIGRFRRPRDMLEAIEQAPGVEAAPVGQPMIAPLPESPNTGAAISTFSLASGAASLLDVLRARADMDGQHPHLKFLTPDGDLSTLTYGELWEQGRKAAGGMANLGLVSGERVAILALTGPDFFVAFVGVLCAGGVPVPIYPPVRLDDLDSYVARQSRILRSAGAAFIVSDPLFEAAAALLCSATPSLRESATVASLTDCGAAPMCVATPPELALIQYTSGSTGDPKGVALTHANLLANTEAISAAVVGAGLRPSDVAVSWMPLYHDFGLIGTWMGLGLFAGATIVLISPIDFLAKPALWLWAIDRFRATAVATTPFGLNHVLRRVADDHITGLDLSSLKFAFMGAEPIRAYSVEDFCTRFEPYGFRRTAIAPAYGLAESCVCVTVARGLQDGPRVDHVDADLLATARRAVPAGPGSRTRTLVSVGTPVGDQQIRVVEAHGRQEALPDRHEGRVLVRGKSVMAGYFGRPDATAAVRVGDWLDTGDLGYLADGELFITGRVKDLIIKAGRNFHPQDIEQPIGELPGVRKGCVIAFGEENCGPGGEGIVVVAETTTEPAGHDELEASIRAAVVEATGTSADDVVLIARGTILKTSSGKLRRQETRQAYRDGTLVRSAAGQRPAVGARTRYRVQRSAGRCRETLVGTYIAVMTMSMILMCAGITARLRDRTTTWRFLHRMVRVLFAAIGMSFQRTGVELPDGQAVYVSNHPTDMDPLLLLAAMRQPMWLTAKSRVLTGVLGTLAERLGVVAVEADLESSLVSYEQMNSLLARGESIHIFAEGERRHTPGIYPFRLGAFKLAASAGVPIVPLVLRGSRDVMQGRPYRPAALEVEVLPPVWINCDPSDLAGLAKARAEVRQMFSDASGEALIDTRGYIRPAGRPSIATRFSAWAGRHKVAQAG